MRLSDTLRSTSPAAQKCCWAAIAAVLVAAVPSHAAAEEHRHSTIRRPVSVDFGPLDKLIESAKWDPKRGAYFAPLPDGREAELTLERHLQLQLERVLTAGGIPAGAIVLTEPQTGRVLAMVGRKDSTPAISYALKPVARAASVFKIITAAALVEAGVDPRRAICFHGGSHKILERNLEDDHRRDNRCATLSDAMGRSLNLIFGKLATRELTGDSLRAMAERFFFNHPLPVYPPPQGTDTMVDLAKIPSSDDELDFGRTAAGFGEVRMSPLHGALLAATVANNGVAVTPRLVEAVWKDGRRDDLIPTDQVRVVAEPTATRLLQMMERTVQDGTARKSFRERGRRALGNIEVAGKTGTLADQAPYREYSWFVGFAPIAEPEVVVSALAVNGARWRTRAAALARDALKSYFQVDRSHRHASL